MQSLCTLRVHCRQWPRNTRYQAGATPYLGRTWAGLGPDLHRLDRTSLRLAHSLDHLVGAGEKGFRNRKANRFRAFDVDDKFKLSGLIDRQLGGRSAIENAPHVDSPAAVII